MDRLEDNKFLCFAYDDNKIIDAVKNSGLSSSQIDGVYFGQMEFSDIVKSSGQTCMKVDGVCLSFIDGVMVQIPMVLRSNIDNNIDISTISLSKHKIYLDSSSNIIDAKSSYILSTIFIVFALVTFIKSYDNYNAATKINEKIDSLKQQYNMPPTTIQAKSIIRKLKITAEDQKNIRETIEYILGTKRALGAKIDKIDFKSGKFTVLFKNADARKITNYLEKKYTLNSAVVKNGIVTIGFDI